MGFSANWLALRESADRAARDPGLLAAAATAAGPAPVIVDLGCGTGSMLRALDAQVGPQARWRLVDNDPALLARAVAVAPGRTEGHLLNLAWIEALPLPGASLVTASALLDLASRNWLERLAESLAALRLPLLAALSYDGLMVWDPPYDDDAAITAAFNLHQRRDKGLGPALGPEAATVAAKLLQERGYVVCLAPSPWRLDAKDARLLRQFLVGVADAAEAAGATQATAWLSERLKVVERSRCRIGHIDLVAIPPALIPEKGGLRCRSSKSHPESGNASSISVLGGPAPAAGSGRWESAMHSNSTVRLRGVT